MRFGDRRVSCLVQRGAEADDSRHHPPKKAAKCHYVSSVILVTKHTTDRRCSCLQIYYSQLQNMQRLPLRVVLSIQTT